MGLKTVFLFLTILSASTNATLIKGRAPVYTFPDRTHFAILYDSAYILQAWNSHWKQPFIDFYCFVRKSHLTDGKLMKRTIDFNYGGGVIRPTNGIFMTDTIYLYSDSLFQNVIGYAWPATDSVWINFQEPNPHTHDNSRLNYLECSLHGGVDSSSILEFDPWRNIVNSIIDSGELFSTSFRTLNKKMSAIHNYCTNISGRGIEYSETYDEDTPVPQIVFLYLFHDGILKAIWADYKLNLKGGHSFQNGYVYCDDSVLSSLSKIEMKFKQMLDYTP
jgi:hypothetical protein